MASLEGMTISNSKAKTFRRCPRRYKFKYVDRLESRRKKRHLELGSWIHDLLMHYYDGQDWRERHEQLKSEFYEAMFDVEIDEYGDVAEEAERMMRSYLMEYKAQDKHIHVVDSELDEIITLPNGLRFNFIIDLIVEEGGLLWLWDHRASRRFINPEFMMLDSILARYFYAAHIMGYKPLGGVMFNEIRTKPPTVPERLRDGRLSQRMNIDTDYFTYYQAIRNHRQDPANYERILKHLSRQREKFFRRTRLPKSRELMQTTMTELIDTARDIRRAETRGKFPRTQDRSCEYECDFKDLCIVELHGGDISSLVRMNYRRRTRRVET
jgi:hypothetical protein